MISLSLPPKLPIAELDYRLNWAPVLAAGETITEFHIVSLAGDVVIGDLISSDLPRTTFWLSGGTSGLACKLIAYVRTSQNRTYAVLITVAII